MLPWQAALLAGGANMLGGDQRLSTGQLMARGLQSGLAGAQAAQQAGADERQDMMKMALMQGQMQDSAAQRQAFSEDRKRDQAAALAKQGHLEALAAGKSPTDQALIFAGGDDYVKSRIAANAPLTSHQQAQHDLAKRQFGASQAMDQARLGLDRAKFDHEKSSGGAEATKALMTRARKIQDAMRLQGLNEAEATALIDSHMQTVTDPVSGKSVSYNKATGATTNIEPPRKFEQPIGDRKSPVSMGKMAGQTGIVPVMQDFWARTAGQFDPEVVDTAKAEAATALRHLKHRARSALMNNPRGAIWEQQQIDKQLPEEGIFESPVRAMQILQTTKDMLAKQHQYNADMINSGDLTSDVEQQLRAKNVEIESVHSLMKDEPRSPPQDQPQPDQPQEQGQAQANIAGAAADLGVDQSLVIQAAKEAGVSPDEIITKLRSRQ